MNNLIIRKAVGLDSKKILEIEQDSFGFDAFNLSQIKYLINKACSDFMVVLSNDDIVASIVLLKKSNSRGIRLYSLAVSANHRGKGVAQLLLNHTFSLAVSKKYEFITLEVRCDNITAITLYKKNGFCETKILKEYYKDASDALQMRKTIL
jgi:[ribosomal protein S18]-alanine N-acetyltransferase